MNIKSLLKLNISMLLAVVMFFNITTAYASDYLSEPFCDDFEDSSFTESNWRFAATGDSTNLNPLSSTPLGNIVEENGNSFYRLESNSANHSTLVFPLAEPVTDNLEIEFKAKFYTKPGAPADDPNIEFFAIVGDETATKKNILFQLYRRITPTYAYISANHAYGASPGVQLKRVEDIDSDKFYSYRLTINLEERKVTAFFEDENIGTFDFALKTTPILSISRVVWTAYKGIGNVTYVDDVKIEKNVPLKLLSSNPSNNQVNVDHNTESVELEFNKPVDMNTTGAITLKCGTDNVPVTVEKTGENTLNVRPIDSFLPLEEYILEISDQLAAVDGKQMVSSETIRFTTKMMDPIQFNTSTAEFLQNRVNVSANIYANEQSEIVVLASLYEIRNGVKTFVESKTQNYTLEQNDLKIFSESFDVGDKEYQVEITAFEKDGINPVALVKAFDKDGEVSIASEEIDDGLVLDEMDLFVDYDTGIVTVLGDVGDMQSSYRTIQVTGDNGEIVYLGQRQTVDRGKYKFSFIAPGSFSTTKYSVVLDGTELTAPITNQYDVDYSKFKCGIADQLTIGGELTGGNILNTEYDFYSAINSPEGDSIIKWYISDKQEDGYVEKSDSKTYTIGENDEYKYIKASLQPIAKTGGAIGEVVFSQPQFITSKPVVSGVKMDIAPVVGSVITADYTYSHKIGNKEKGSVFKWLISDSQNGVFTEVGSGIKYTPKEIDQGKYLKFSVLPKCEEVPFEGIAVETDAYRVAAKPVTSVGGGGGGSSYGGGTSTTSMGVALTDIKIPQPLEEKEPEKPLPYSDIEGHWAMDVIKQLAEAKIVSGKGDGIFAPDDDITRAEFVTLIVRVLELESLKYINMFTDVKPTDWYANAVQTIVTHGIASGFEGSFRPNDIISREEAAKLIVAASENQEEIELSTHEFTDSQLISEWAKEYVLMAHSLGFIKGTDDGSFLPKKGLTRAEAATVVLRLQNSL